jgi:trans-aconitate methyltransferase
MNKNNFNISVKRFDEFAEQYLEKFKNIEGYIPSIDKFCKLIKTKNPKILELACGPGNITKYVKQKFPHSEYLAIDLASNMIEIAKTQVNDVEFRLLDVREISKIDNKFDAIMCSFCLPFLSKSDAYTLIADCADRLNKDGVIYISTMEGDESKAGFETTSFTGSSEVYFNYHEKQDLEKALLDNGFIIKEFKRQEFHEPNGITLIDLIFIGTKK